MTKENLIIHNWYVLDNGLTKAMYYGYYEVSNKYIFMTDTYYEIQLTDLKSVSAIRC